MSKKKTIISAGLIALLCAAVIVGSTFALFAVTRSSDVAVTTGSVDISAELSGLATASLSPDAENVPNETAGKFATGGTAELNGNKLTLTGNLGDVMKESAMLAFEYVHSHAASLGIPYEVFDNWNIHVHVPEGAIPDTAQSQEEPCHDWRDDAARQGAPGRWHQGEDTRCKAGRHHRHTDLPRE